MANSLDRILSGSPYGYNGEGEVNYDKIDPDALRQALLTIGRGAIAEPVSGIAGLVSTPFGVDTAVDNMESVRDFIGYQPEDADILKYISQIAEPVTEWAKENIGNLREKAGGYVLDKTSSPGLASIAHSAPEVLGLLTGAGMMMPAIKSASRGVGKSVGEPDKTRRNMVLGGAGLAAASALAPKMAVKSLMDAPVGTAAAKSVGGKTAATAVMKGAMRAGVSSTSLRFITMLNAYPRLKAAFKAGGRKGFEKEFNSKWKEAEEGRRLELNELEENYGHLTQEEYLPKQREIIDRYQDKFDDLPIIDNASRKTDKHGRELSNDGDFSTVDWDEVGKNIDNKVMPNKKNTDYGDMEYMDLDNYESAYSYIHDLGGFETPDGLVQTLKNIKSGLTDKRKIKQIDDALNDPDMYDNYINQLSKDMNLYNLEWSF